MSLRECMTRRESLEYRISLTRGKPRRAAAVLFYACLRKFPNANWLELYARCWEYTTREHMSVNRPSNAPRATAATSAQSAT